MRIGGTYEMILKIMYVATIIAVCYVGIKGMLFGNTKLEKKRYSYFNSKIAFNVAKVLLLLFAILTFLSTTNIINQSQRDVYGLIWFDCIFLNWYIDNNFLG